MDYSDLKSYFNPSPTAANTNPKQLYGVEYEKFIFYPKDGRYQPLPMEGECSVSALLAKLAELSEQKGKASHRWDKEFEKDSLIGLENKELQKVTIEPGGQIELSDAPRASLKEVAHALEEHITELEEGIQHFGGKILFCGVNPVTPLQEIPLSSKARYQIMFEHMSKVGTLGQLMMKGSTGVQVNIDYESIEDMERKFVVLNRLVPFLVAIFANSPLYEGKNTGFQSFRANVWRNTDSSRAGVPDAFRQQNFCINDYVEWALDAAPYFLSRNEEIIPLTGTTFRQLLSKKNLSPRHAALDITLDDWEAHLGMLFPEMRVKHIIELRPFDSLPPNYVMAIPALTKAIAYSESAFSKMQTLMMDLKADQFDSYHEAAVKEGLRAEVSGLSFAKMGRQLLEIALETLGSEEEHYLLPYFDAYTKNGKTPADETLANFAQAKNNAQVWLNQELNRRS